MENIQHPTRKIPFLATIIAFLTGMGAIYGFLMLLHIHPRHSDLIYVLDQQSSAYRALYMLTNLCSLVGAVLLWKMNPLSIWFYAARPVTSFMAIFLFHPAVGSRPINVPLLIGEFCVSAAIIGYVWWVTERWQATRPIAIERQPL